jgi:starch synthase (maltosyl-transferring)
VPTQWNQNTLPVNENQILSEHEGRRRVVVEDVTPEIHAGRFAIKRIIGDRVVVETDIFADGHDSLAAVLKFRSEENPEWEETPMEILVNDRWRGAFTVTKLGIYFFTIEAWADQFKSWQADLQRDAGGHKID